MKVWKDIDEVVKATIEVPKTLHKYDTVMKKTPKKWDEKENKVCKNNKRKL